MRRKESTGTLAVGRGSKNCNKKYFLKKIRVMNSDVPVSSGKVVSPTSVEGSRCRHQAHNRNSTQFSPGLE